MIDCKEKTCAKTRSCENPRKRRDHYSMFIHFSPLNVRLCNQKMIFLRYMQGVKLDSRPKLHAEEDSTG